MTASFRRLSLLLVTLTLILSGTLSACSTKTADHSFLMASMDGMPAEVQSAPVTVQQAYQFAVANPDVMTQIPCYCGCGSMGHTSNYSCYVSSDGTQMAALPMTIMPWVAPFAWTLPRTPCACSKTARPCQKSRLMSIKPTPSTARPICRSEENREKRERIVKRIVVSWLILGIAALLVAFAPLNFQPATLNVERVFHVEAGDFAYSPAILTVNPGDKVTIELASTDVVHGLYVDGYGVSVTADPGQPATLSFIADRPGTFRLRCSVTCGALHPFMIGKLQVGSNLLLWRGIGLAFISLAGILFVRQPKLDTGN